MSEYEKLDDHFNVLQNTDESDDKYETIKMIGRKMRKYTISSKTKKIISFTLLLMSISLIMSMVLSVNSVPVLLETYTKKQVMIGAGIALYVTVVLYTILYAIYIIFIAIIKSFIKYVFKNAIFLLFVVPFLVVMFPFIFIASVIIYSNF